LWETEADAGRRLDTAWPDLESGDDGSEGHRQLVGWWAVAPDSALEL